MPKKTTEELLEDLAQMVKHGFDETATRHELQGLRKDMETGFRAIADALDLIRQDFAEIQRTLSLLAQTVGSEIADLRSRVERIEKQLGLTK